ncbi:Protein of unknown function [Eubacterium aggregans]|uniref:Putative Se/S carrier protein-like domain-containing protein n=1 Tax=Eubacterium aggregans TaxID=81409 RepID=A0A1H4CDV2_9FIRM|nr:MULTISPECIES: DUF3343 domain-containing protein [Clostridia]MEA5004093.1 DUF3343 domain-containing protein [Christensenella sp.]SEA58473.1 Protein of unknown function [Eubacterium aggregans]
MRDSDYGIIAFENTHSAMTAERVLTGLLDFILMPTPREIAAGCGIAMRLSLEAVPEALAQLDTAGFDSSLRQAYRIITDDGAPRAEALPG